MALEFESYWPENPQNAGIWESSAQILSYVLRRIDALLFLVNCPKSDKGRQLINIHEPGLYENFL